jgi:hypothetical protein
MNKYRVCLINEAMNFRKVLEVMAETCVQAVNAACAKVKGLGYDKVESAVMIEAN